MQKNKINYSMLEEEFIKYVHKTYRIYLFIQNLSLRPIDIGMDSLDAVEMLLWAEEKYGIKNMVFISSIAPYGASEQLKEETTLAP